MDKEAAKQEIAKLIADFEKNRDYYNKTDEANIETKLIEPLFAALGWTHNDFEKREKVKRKDSRGISDYMFKMQGKRVFVLEAKKIKVDVNGDRETWKQAISYTLSNRVRFAVLTNFENMLIFCTVDENAMRPFRKLKYVEYASRFDELWLLSKESFEQNLIFDRAESEGRMKKTHTIDDKLLDDMLLSRKNIVESVEHNYPGNYSTLQKDDIAQRIFGRLVFIRKCEDKEINFDKDNKEIEHLTEVTLLPHNEAYPKLKKIFAKYNDAFDSELFKKDFDSDVDKIDIDGKVIKELVRHTYDSRDGNYVYNFEWIDADVLGNIYEKYLGHILKETAKQTRLKESHAHRKEQGIYYTPIDIVKYIVDNTLGEMLKGMKPGEVRKLKVLDPACGSGSFLIKAFDVLEEHYEKHPLEKQRRMDSSGDFYTTQEQVLVNNIHGVDLDHKAVEIAQLNLLLMVAAKGHRLPLLQKNIQNGNSLIDDDAVAGDMAFKWQERFSEIIQFDDKGGLKDGYGFDVIIGNPPYVRPHHIDSATKKFLWKTSKVVKAKGDLYAAFIEKGILLLKEGGLFSFIVPWTWLSLESFDDLRRLILETCKIGSITIAPHKVFQDATVETLIFVFERWSDEKERRDNLIEIRNISENGRATLIGKKKQELFSQSRVFDISVGKDTELISKIERGKQKLDSLVNFFYGLKTADDDKFLTFNPKNQSEYKKLIRRSDFGRYSIGWKGEYVCYNPVLMKKNKMTARPGEPERFEQEKIVIMDIAKKLVCTVDEEKYYVKDALILKCTAGQPVSVSLFYLAGLINSRLLNYYYKQKYKVLSVAKNAFLELPIQIGTVEQQRNLTGLVEQMLSLNKKLAEFGDKNTPETARLKEEIGKTDAQIDELVYKIYGITDEEKKIIEDSFKQ